VSSTNTENPALICDYSSAEFWNIKVNIKSYLLRSMLLNFIEMDVLSTPLEVMNWRKYSSSSE